MTATVRDLLAELGPATDFADAACIGRWAWFDPPNDHEAAASVQSRHEAAVHVCGTCPLHNRVDPVHDTTQRPGV